jgi:eukaryotic-like serine/threonine-protein kinase
VHPADATITPVSRLRAAYREEIDARADDYAVTRPRSRRPSTVVNARAAALLERFRQPKTIVDAVVELSLGEGLDPRAILDDAAQMVRRFADEGVLAPAGSPLAAPIVAELAPGDRLGEIEVVEPVQVLVDVEVHRGRAVVDSKIKKATAELKTMVLARDSRLMDIHGVGPVVDVHQSSPMSATWLGSLTGTGSPPGPAHRPWTHPRASKTATASHGPGTGG